MATAGGEVITLIDCEHGHVLSKYTHPGEDFYALAWTKLTLDESEEPVCLLAAAGEWLDCVHVCSTHFLGLEGDIKVLDTTQNSVFAQFGDCGTWVNSLVFHPSMPTLLLSEGSILGLCLISLRR